MQYARPIADLTTGSWTVTPLWSKLDETPLSNADNVASNAVTTGTTSAARVQLSAVTDPITNAGFSFNVMASKSNTNRVVFAVIDLYQGATLIQSTSTAALTTTSTIYNVALSVANIANITDFSDLRAEFYGSITTGSGSTALVLAGLELEVPDLAQSLLLPRRRRQTRGLVLR